MIVTFRSSDKESVVFISSFPAEFLKNFLTSTVLFICLVAIRTLFTTMNLDQLKNNNIDYVEKNIT